jgi:two-component sensor histidine kinase
MNTNDLDTSIGFRKCRVIPAERQSVADADADTRTEPDKTSASLRIDVTANAALQARIRDLSRENDEMNNMLEGSGIAVVLLDRRLRVVRVTPMASEIGSGRLVEVIAEARSVLDTLHPKQIDIEATDGRWYRTYLNPYRTLEGGVDGVVVSFIDISEHRRAVQEIARQLAEKDTLLKEVHHRVRNNIGSIVGLLSIQAQSIVDSETRSLLKGAIGRVESMSILYDKLLVSEQYGACSVKNYLEDLAQSVLALFSAGTNATLEMRVADFDVKPDDLFLLGLITNELLTNVMKYAVNGRTDALITLVLERSGNRVKLIVQDDGEGLPPGFDPDSVNGFGLSLVRMLSEQLGGSFSISTRNGTRSVVDFDL